jgi:hypothetical protein
MDYTFQEWKARLFRPPRDMKKDPLPDKDVLANYIPSKELHAASKFIGRECATVNREFIECGKEARLDKHPETSCLKQGDLVTACTVDV